MHIVSSDHQMPTDADWPLLTASERKRDLYQEDLHFREGWADTVEVCGPDAAAVLSPLALLSFKCDGVAARRMHRTLDYLTEHGFEVTAAAPVRLTRHSMRELWRFNWHVYPADRLKLMTVMHTASETALLLLRDLEYDGVLPGSTRLADLKGPAAPAGRQPHQLRAVLDPPNTVINFVHVADEPADVVRELAIFLDWRERRSLLSAVCAPGPRSAEFGAKDLVARLEAENPAHEFDFELSLDTLESSGVLGAAGRARLTEAAHGGRPLTWSELTAVVDPGDPATGVWDFVCVATEVLPAKRASSPDLLPASGPRDWAARAAAAAD